MECSCSIDGYGDDEQYYDCDTAILAWHCLQSFYICDECGKKFKEGDRFECAKCFYENPDDGEPEELNIHVTCLDCLSLRENFFRSWSYGMTWDDFRIHAEECNGQLPEKCIAKLTPMAREKVCEIIEKCWEK